MSNLPKQVLISMTVILIAGGVVSAHEVEPREKAQEKREAVQQQIAERKEAVQQKVEEKRQTAQSKLSDGKLKACQKRESNIKRIMSRAANRGTRQIEVFSKISDRTQAFYKDKGKTLSNYEQLVEAVETKQAAAKAAVESTSSSSTEFSCDSADPKASAQGFKQVLKQQNAALKEYKTAVKNLIVGVKSVQGKEGSSKSEDQS